MKIFQKISWKNILFVFLVMSVFFFSQVTNAKAVLNPGGPVTEDTLNSLDPLVLEASPYKDEFRTPAGVLSRLVNNYLFPAAGMILFVTILLGGFEMITSSVGAKKNAGRERITAALIGFLLLFSAYWIGQLIQAIFGVKFL